MNDFDRYLIVCKNPLALNCLKKELCLVGLRSEKGKPMSQGDALCGRDALLYYSLV